MLADHLEPLREPRPARRVVIAPHADDETLGCGGLLAKYHDECAVIVLAHVDDTRAAEFRHAQELLGYPLAYLLDLPDGNVGRDMHSLVGLIDNALRMCKPHELYLPYPSLHQDHVAAYEAGMRAARLSMTEGHWFPPTVMVYDVNAYDVSLYPTDLRWNVFESLDEVDIDKKVVAASAYRSQQVSGHHPVNRIKECAQAIGSVRQLAWAEQYALVRFVRGAGAPLVHESSEVAQARVPDDAAQANVVPAQISQNGHIGRVRL